MLSRSLLHDPRDIDNPSTKLTGCCRSTSSLLPMPAESNIPSFLTSTHRSLLHRLSSPDFISTDGTARSPWRSSSDPSGTDESILNWLPERMSMSAKCSVPTRQVVQLIRAEREGEYISLPLPRCTLPRPNHSPRSRLLTVKQVRECVSGSVSGLQDTPANATSSLGGRFGKSGPNVFVPCITAEFGHSVVTTAITHFR